MAKVFILNQLKYMLTFINLNRHPIETTNFWERNLYLVKGRVPALERFVLKPREKVMMLELECPVDKNENLD